MEGVRRIIGLLAYFRVAVTVIVCSAENENFVRVLTHHFGSHLKIIIVQSLLGRLGLPCDARTRHPEIFDLNSADFSHFIYVFRLFPRRAHALCNAVSQKNHFHLPFTLVLWFSDKSLSVFIIITFNPQKVKDCLYKIEKKTVLLYDRPCKLRLFIPSLSYFKSGLRRNFRCKPLCFVKTKLSLFKFVVILYLLSF